MKNRCDAFLEPPDVIARLWSARTTPSLSSAYLNHFEQAVQPQLRKLHGFLGACVATRSQNTALEILVTTYWDSFAAIDAFAAPDRECAVVADEAATLLTDFDRRVRHYELAIADFPREGTGSNGRAAKNSSS